MSLSVNLGGDRIGSGAKIKVDMSNFGRSTFNQSKLWKSTAGAGMLIPCYMNIGTNETTFDIDIKTMGHTIPTIGPLFDGFKLQVDLFACPIRLYQGLLHNNAVNIGLKMNQVLLPNITLGNGSKKSATNPSSLLNYLGIKGYHSNKHTFNAVPILAYYDIFKNYYANKQEKYAKVLGWQTISNQALTINTPDSFQLWTGDLANEEQTEIQLKTYIQNGLPIKNFFEFKYQFTIKGRTTLQLKFNKQNVDLNEIIISLWKYNSGLLNFTRNVISNNETDVKKYSIVDSETDEIVGYYWTNEKENCINVRFTGLLDSDVATIWGIQMTNKVDAYQIIDFPLENIDNARREILAKTGLNERIALNNPNPEEEDDNNMNYLPYSLNFENDDINYLKKDFMGLCLKTYQSDIFNNWLDNENVELVNELSAINLQEDGEGNPIITMDSFILAKKIYNVLNRIAVSGGTYEDWQESVWGSKAIRRAESPIYIGGTSAQIQFEEVVSTAQTQVDDVYQPLGNLGGKGGMINKQGGSIIYKCEEPTIILGIMSITPIVNYSQGNNWIMTNLDNMNNLHKPELDGIGFQNLIENNVHWAGSPNVGLAKQTAWLNYQTEINEVFGQFAIPKDNDNSLHFMTLQRDYEVNNQGAIQDFTTYIDPSKYNYAFADNSLTAQNFWIQLYFDVKARRKMAAYQIPNL